MRQLLSIILFFSLAFPAISQDTITVVKENKDTLLIITKSEVKTSSITYTQSSVVYVNKPYQAPVATPPPVDSTPVPGYALVYANGFDSKADLDPDSHGQIGNGSLSTSLFLTGPGSFKAVPANVSSGIRSEVQFDDNRTPSEGAIEYDVYYQTAFKDNGHSFQFHPQTSGGSSSPGLWHNGGKFDMVNWKGGTNTHHQSSIAIPTGKWIHFRYEYKFGSSGYWRTYIDGSLVPSLSWTGQVGDGSGQYLKIGTNQWVSATSVVYYDNLKIFKKL